MKCMSCKEEVSSKFAHAISKNECPFCGAAIVSEELQILLSELKILMDDAVKYPEETADWFWSNYQMKKVDPKSVESRQYDDISPEEAKARHLAEHGQTIFAKRAGVKIKSVKDRENFAQVIEQITSDNEMERSENKTIEQLEAEEAVLADVPKTPLNQMENQQLFDVFDMGAENPVLELEKVKRLHRQSMSGEAKVKRTE